MLFADRVRAAALIRISAALVLLFAAHPVRSQALFESAAATAQAEVSGTSPAPVPPAAAPESIVPPAATPVPPAATPPPPAAEGAAPTAPAAPAAPAPPAPAPDNATDQATLDEIRQPSAYLRTAIESLETNVEAARENDEELARQRLEIEALIQASDLFLESLQPRYKAVTLQIEKLGPPPAKDQPAEAPAIAEERQRLGYLSAEIDGAIKATGLIQYRARELLSRVQDYRTRIFTGQLFRRNASPLSLNTWSTVADALPPAATELKWTFWRWRRSAEDNLFSIFALLGSAAAVYFLLARVRRRVFAARLDAPRETEPDFFQRAATAGWVASLNVLPSALAVTLIAFGFDNLGLWFLDSDRIVFTVLPAALVFIAVRALARAILQPKRADWRLVDLADKPAASLSTAMTWIGAIYAIDLLLKEAIRILAMPL
jgi:small-conductance mechanosensitive channel